MLKDLRDDIDNILKLDPAARSALEVALCYPGFHALLFHRAAHWLWTRHWLVLGRLFIATATAMPGTTDQLAHMSYLAPVYNSLRFDIMPAVMLAAVAGLIWLCASGAWQMNLAPAGQPARLPKLV